MPTIGMPFSCCYLFSTLVSHKKFRRVAELEFEPPSPCASLINLLHHSVIYTNHNKGKKSCLDGVDTHLGLKL